MAQKRDLLIQIAKLYYVEQKTQQEIADMLFLSRSNVSRLLKICVEKEIVEFYINETTALGEDLANKIKDKFNLLNVIIAPKQVDEEKTKQVLGQMVANYLRNHISTGMKLGVAWGTTLYSVACALTKIPNVYVDVVQLVGGMGAKSIDTDGMEITRKLAYALNGDALVAHVPYMVKKKELKYMLLEERDIKEHFSQKIDLALVGIGSVNKSISSIRKAGYLTEEEIELLAKEGAVSDICGIHFDKNGLCCAKDISDRILGVNYEQLKNIPNVIGVCVGAKKADAMHSCLKSKILHTIAIDEYGANALLERA